MNCAITEMPIVSPRPLMIALSGLKRESQKNSGLIV